MIGGQVLQPADFVEQLTFEQFFCGRSRGSMARFCVEPHVIVKEHLVIG